MNTEHFKALGFAAKEMAEFPNIVNIEVYRGGCPCSCVHCPVGMTDHHDRESRFGKRSIGLELYEKVVREIATHPHSTLRIHSVGEPILWEGLLDALTLAHEYAVRSWLFTSAVTANSTLLEGICENANVVEVSVNSTTPEDYSATKGVNAFRQVCENIAYMHQYIREKELSTRLVVSRVQSSEQGLDEEFIRYWKSSELVHDAFVRSYHTYNDILAQKVPASEQSHQPCLVHWARFNVSVDGYVVVCFNELFKPLVDPSLILGDVRQNSIAEIWHGHPLNSLRQAELRGDYLNLPFGDRLPCKNCTSCQPLGGNRQTSEYQVNQLKSDTHA